ncbi:hypothetical protein L596_028981 [Steinernema carpocapsae]|uniref:HMG box domain-containing protein n=1 Tax=Steinernema carpocapsae TaxID=34508 RepID=A0A4U5LT97_STECR|nr:hypothetical protein L596_028981 [Steinernema carpocapsae]
MKMSLSPDPQGTVDEDETKVFREDDDEIRDEDETKVFKEEEDDEVEDEVSTLEADTVNSDNQEVAKETEHLGRSFMPPNFAAAMANMANLMNSPVYQAMRTQAMISPMFMPIQNPYGMMSPVLAAAASPSFGYAPQLLQGIAPHIPFGQYPQHLLQCRNPLTPSAQNTPRRQARRAEERIKKPLNSFMLYMKCNRKKMLEENAEYRKMQSAELNKVMGENWQKLTPEERNVYEDMAKKEQENHKLKYPNWTARDNYAVHKRRTRRDRVEDIDFKKCCRARLGKDNRSLWCKACQRKKRCQQRGPTPPLVSSSTHQENLLNPMNLHESPSPMSSQSGISATSSASGHFNQPNSVRSEAGDSEDNSDVDEEMSDREADETITGSQKLGSQNVPLQMSHPMPQIPQMPHFPQFANPMGLGLLPLLLSCSLTILIWVNTSLHLKILQNIASIRTSD